MRLITTNYWYSKAMNCWQQRRELCEGDQIACALHIRCHARRRMSAGSTKFQVLGVTLGLMQHVSAGENWH
jgi:hypothetical protein